MRKGTPVAMAHTREDDEDLVLLRQCMRPEEDLLEYRRRVPWKGEYRFFRSRNVLCLEHYSSRWPPHKPDGPPRGFSH